MRVWGEREMHDARWTQWCDHGAACSWQAESVCRIIIKWRGASEGGEVEGEDVEIRVCVRTSHENEPTFVVQ